MPVLYVFLDKESGEIYSQGGGDTLFSTSDGTKVASEQMLAALTCGESPKFAMLNAYQILQPTYEFETGDIFASSADAPDSYCYKGADYNGLSSRCLTTDDVGNEEWFEQVEYLEDYL